MELYPEPWRKKIEKEEVLRVDIAELLNHELNKEDIPGMPLGNIVDLAMKIVSLNPKVVVYGPYEGYDKDLYSACIKELNARESHYEMHHNVLK